MKWAFIMIKSWLKIKHCFHSKILQGTVNQGFKLEISLFSQKFPRRGKLSPLGAALRPAQDQLQCCVPRAVASRARSSPLAVPVRIVEWTSPLLLTTSVGFLWEVWWWSARGSSWEWDSSCWRPRRPRRRGSSRETSSSPMRWVVDSESLLTSRIRAWPSFPEAAFVVETTVNNG